MCQVSALVAASRSHRNWPLDTANTPALCRRNSLAVSFPTEIGLLTNLTYMHIGKFFDWRHSENYDCCERMAPKPSIFHKLLNLIVRQLGCLGFRNLLVASI